MLDWLPIKYRIWLKILLLTFKGFYGNPLSNIKEMITPQKSRRYFMRSDDRYVPKVPKFNKSKRDTFGKVAFAEWAYSCDLISIIIANRPRMLSAQFVKLYNPCRQSLDCTLVRKREIQLSWDIYIYILIYEICIYIYWYMKYECIY